MAARVILGYYLFFLGLNVTTPAKTDRIPALDGLRGLAIVMVVLHHYFGVKLLWMGVDLFFILSGFLVTGILLRGKDRPFKTYIGQFYLRRLQRIFPSYLAVLALCAMFFGTGWLAYWYMYLGGMNFILALDLPRIYSLPLWSLAVEEQFYLLWPIAVYFCSRTALRKVSVGMMVLAPVLRFVCTPYIHARWAVYSLLPFRMDCLATGALIALLWPQLRELLTQPTFRRRLTLSGGLMATAALACLFVLAKLGLNTISNTPVGNTLIYACSLMCMSYVFLLAASGSLRGFSTCRY